MKRPNQLASAKAPQVPVTSAQPYGLVLAGGHSTRLGRDKAALVFEGATLLQRATKLLALVCQHCFVSVTPQQLDDPLRRNYPSICDGDPPLGPMGGLYAAQLAHPGVAWLILAVDMPQVDQALLQRLLQARRPDLTATVYRSAERVQPLCGIYEPSSHPAIAQAIQNNHTSLRRLLAGQAVHWLQAPSSYFENINDPTAWQQLVARG